MIIDKAKWHIDKGVNKDLVVGHFVNVFNFLSNNGYLNGNGQEIVDEGLIDEDISLHSELLINIDFEKFNDAYNKTLKSEAYGEIKFIDELKKNI